MVEVSLQLLPQEAADQEIYLSRAARAAGVDREHILFSRIVRRSIDARSRLPKVNLTIELALSADEIPLPLHFDYPDVSTAPQVVVVGSGPAGLFAGLRLLELGYRPVILERGKDVSSRKRDLATLNRGGAIDPDSNYAFGEGGAGAFSDGKLFTRSKKRGDYTRVLETLVFHGADPGILYDAHPHIGSDKLPGVISNIRKTILACGGIFEFGKRVTGLMIKGGEVSGVLCGDQAVEGLAVILATGHSAHDIYEMLDSADLALEAKPYAMGVRVEHPQPLIDTIQYHMPERGEHLPAATYSLVSQVGGRGVYSFCMCPGGVIVPAMTDSSQCVVNGMSAAGRNSPFANSAIVTEVRLTDYEHLKEKHGALAGLVFRQQFEQAARAAGGQGQVAPGQRLGDFLKERLSTSLPESSYLPGVQSSRLSKWMPGFIAESLRGGILSFENKMRGFISDRALLVGVESRTSTPVRIPRDPNTLAHPQLDNLFPAGEGAGYAGGIVSAALDGINVAEAVVRKKHKNKP